MTPPEPLSLLPLAGSWQEQLQDAIRDPRELAEALGLAPGDFLHDEAAAKQFPLLVPRAFVDRMRRGDPQDPLLRQVLAAPEENLPVDGYVPDPLGEREQPQRDAALLRKYRGRALLLLTGQCAVNCRYCFRRHYPYGDGATSSARRLQQIRELAANGDVSELILSGGDPLLLPDARLREIAETAAVQPSLRTLRIHSRLPVVLPARVTQALPGALVQPGLRTVMVLHINHRNEIDATLRSAIAALREAGMTVLNQSVLLAGVNDSVTALAELSEALFDAGVLPYYLHLLDPVAGAAHFEVPEARARRLVGELAEQLPGYLLPRLAREVPGAASKQVLAPDYETQA